MCWIPSAFGIRHFLSDFCLSQSSYLARVPVQKLVYKELVQGQFNDPIENIFCKRLAEAVLILSSTALFFFPAALAV